MQLFIRDITFDACRRANQQLPGRADKTRFYKTHGGDDTLFADDCAIHDYAVHAHQRITTNHAAVKDCAVPDMPVFMHDGVGIAITVHDAAILKVSARLKNQTPIVAAQRCKRADIDAGTDDDIANQHGAGMHVRLWMYYRNQAFKGVIAHGYSSVIVVGWRLRLIRPTAVGG